MKIDTLDTWNLILGGCGCCPMPTCPTPEKECESIEIPFTCYFTLPVVSSVPEEERDCRRFAKKVYGYLFEQEESDNPATGDYFSKTENTVTTDEAKYDAGEDCYFCSNTIDYSLVEITDYPSQSRDEKYEAYSTSVCGLSCDGEEIYTDYNDSNNNYTADFDYCVPIKFEADNTYTRTGDVFEFVEVSGITTITITNSYEDELDADFAVTVLEGKSFDEDVNGEYCTSEIATDEDDDSPLERPDWWPENFWKKDEAEPDLQAMAKSWGDLRKQISQGKHKAPADGNYDVAAFKDIPAEDPVRNHVLSWAKEYGVSQAALTYEGVTHSGFVQRDDQGEPYFSMQ